MNKYVSQQDTEGDDGNYSFIHPLVVLIKIVMDPESIPETLGAKNENTLDGASVQHDTTQGHTFAHRYHNVKAQFIETLK